MYDYVGAFHEGLAVVAQGKKWGFINPEGEQVIQLKFDWACHFLNGIAAVCINNRYAYIDKSGNFITPLKYSDACNAGDRARIMYKGKQGMLHPRTYTEVWFKPKKHTE